MTTERNPEAWIGQEVGIHMTDHREYLATLLGVRGFGFLYQTPGDEYQVFMPWSAIRWMRPPGSDAEIMRREELGEFG